MKSIKRYEELEREANKTEQTYPPSWNPVQGTKLIGEIIKINLAKSVYGGLTPVIQVYDERSKEKHSLWISHAVLRQWCEREQPQVGDLIWVECQGKNEKGYLEFKTSIGRDKFNWSDHLNRRTGSETNSPENDVKDPQQNNDRPTSPCAKDENRMFYRLPGSYDWNCSVCIPLPQEEAIQAEWAESLPF